MGKQKQQQRRSKNSNEKSSNRNTSGSTSTSTTTTTTASSSSRSNNSKRRNGTSNNPNKKQKKYHYFRRPPQHHELHPSRAPIMSVFRFIKFITILAGLLMGSIQFISTFMDDDLELIESIIHFYMLAFCFLVILNETNFYSFTKDSKLLQIWIFRGGFYAFIGILGLNECEEDLSTAFLGSGNKEQDGIVEFTYFMSCLFIVLGGIYVIMGLLCLQWLHDKLEEEYQEKVQHARELRNHHNTNNAIKNKYGAIYHDDDPHDHHDDYQDHEESDSESGSGSEDESEEESDDDSSDEEEEETKHDDNKVVVKKKDNSPV